jgi:formate dehydrogenase subunit gamma
MHSSQPRLSRHLVLAFGALLLCGALLSAVALYFGYPAPDAAVAADAVEEVNPRAAYWRDVRAAEAGYTSASGPFTTDVLIDSGGQTWRELRNGPVATFGAWGFAGLLVLIALFHLFVGPQRPEQPPSGDRVPRWSVAERTLHWYTAILFIILAVTGLSLLFGRAVLIPLFGLEGFAAYAALAKSVHGYLGPFFLAGVLIEVVTWMRFNRFKREDLRWLRDFGGLFSRRHAHAGRTNGGEKVWFWFIATAGLIGVGLSGLVLDFPIFGQDRGTMQTANLVHSVLGMIWIAIALGHIYIGTAGTPGTFEGMTKGHVSKEWAQTHHDRWYAQQEREGKVGPAEDLPGRGAHGGQETPGRQPSR